MTLDIARRTTRGPFRPAAITTLAVGVTLAGLSAVVTVASADDTAPAGTTTTDVANVPRVGSAANVVSGIYLKREDVRDWIRETSAEHGLDRHRIAGLFARLPVREDILEKIAAPAERTLEWRDYRPIFLGDERAEAGRAFLAEHAATFAQAEERFGVPARVIAAIIGVETFYGKFRGKDSVLEALVTLGFDYPPRADFFRGELAEFLVLADAEGWDPLEIEGSYAGAMGLPQFISSSYREYAVDFDDDGAIDLFDNPADVIGSVGNYLERHGWRRDEPVVEPWTPAEDDRDAARALVREDLEPVVVPELARKLGFEPSQEDDGESLSVMTFEGEAGEEFWVGYTNFYAITRYNHSRLYALAVHQLAEALR